MDKNYFAAWLAAIYPIDLLIDDYKRVAFEEDYDKAAVDMALNQAIIHNVLAIKDNRVYISEDNRNNVYKSFFEIGSYQKEFYLNKIGKRLVNLYTATRYVGLIEIFAELIASEGKAYDIDKVKLKLDDGIFQIFSCGTHDRFFDERMVKIFTSPVIERDVHIAFINVLYKYNQNKHVVYYYNFLNDKHGIDNESLLKISSAYYMIGDIANAQKILDELRSNNAYNRDVITAIKIVELMNKIESSIGKIEKDNLLQEFRSIAREVSLAPKNANLLLKISSSILSHDDAINLMIKSDLSEHVVQTYNNIGALYLTEGYKRYLLNQKDTEYLIKADKYLNFADFLGKDKKEYSPYLELNKITLSFCNKYRKNTLSPSYKTLYSNYTKIIGKADSLYFKSIVLCNRLILAKLQNLDMQTIAGLIAEISDILSSTQDYKVHEKIEDFLSFVPGNRRLPIWIITESHY